MKKTFSICYRIGLLGEILSIPLASYSLSCSQRYCLLFSLLLAPFTLLFAYALFLHGKLPPEERVPPTRTWTVVHHPIGQFATLLAIDLLFLLMALNQATSLALLLLTGVYLATLLLLYLWAFKGECEKNRTRKKENR